MKIPSTPIAILLLAVQGIAACAFAAPVLLVEEGRARATEIIVRDAGALRSALRALQPGTTLRIAPGEYPGGHAVDGIERLTVEALDPQQPPVFKGGKTGFHFSRCTGLTLRRLRISGQSVNGLNLDDGGDLARPVTGVTLEQIDVSDIGPTGNHDGIKCSGLDQLTIRGCTITGWGGQGIDVVGCHRSLITGCRLVGKEGFSASAGIQLKGGSSDITVENCHFTKAGERPVNLGGSTGLPYFRPQGAKHEAARLIVRNNTFEGGLCAAAFVGVDGAEFAGNTIRYPDKWIFRILQETQQPGFAPCRNVLIKENRITFRRAQVRTEINIGGGTAPETFRFENNHWFAEDQPEASRPALPAEEKNGVYGRGLLPPLAAASQTPITFPADGGVLDVRAFGAVADDEQDDTAALQKALDQHPNGNRIIYLPPGRWIVRDTLKWPQGARGGMEQKRTILQGAGQALTILELPDATPGFTDAAKPKAMIWTGNRPAQRFRNAVRDLTVVVGKGNPGAIGLQFNASNQGTIRNVSIRAAEGSGAIGLDMGFTDEIGPLLVRNLIVEGFEVGIVTKWPVNSATFERVTLRGQRKYGWWNYHQMIFVRGLDSENAVPAIFNEKDSWGTVTLVDSRIVGKGAGPKTPGILNQRGLYLRNVDISGYATSVENADKGRDKGDIVGPGRIAEETSHRNVAGLFRSIPDGTPATAGPVTHLPVKESPVIPWGDPGKDWVSLLKFGADPTGKADASPALQVAIDSGAKTVYLPAGSRFRFDSEVEIRGPVERIIGLEGSFHAEGQAVWTLVDNKHPRGLADAKTVILERMSSTSGGKSLPIRHESQRTLVVSSTIGFGVEGHGAGDIFLDDFCGLLNLFLPGQNAWCRQLNTEREGTMLRNNGGRLWILGMKTEKIGTIIETLNGGVTDAAGIFIYSNQGWNETVPAFIIDNSAAVLAGINERNFNRRPVSLWFRETQGIETRESKFPVWVYLSAIPIPGQNDNRNK